MSNSNSTSADQISTGVLRVLGKGARENINRVVKFQPIFADLNKGESLRLSISGSAWPAIAINSGHAEIVCEAPNPKCKITTIKLCLFDSKLCIKSLVSELGFQELRLSD